MTTNTSAREHCGLPPGASPQPNFPLYNQSYAFSSTCTEVAFGQAVYQLDAGRNHWLLT